jgi:hypothetical protein
MSWTVFENNMKRFYSSIGGVTDSDAVAKKLAAEYDNTVKRGLNVIYNISVQSGNTQRMVEGFSTAFKLGRVSPASFDIIGALGVGVIGYWSSVNMKLLPAPTLPAPGTVLNYTATKSILINPGIWPPQSPIPPSPSPDLFLKLFITNSITHLNTIAGMVITVSQYPSVPPIIAPAIINWQGYTVP